MKDIIVLRSELQKIDYCYFFIDEYKNGKEQSIWLYNPICYKARSIHYITFLMESFAALLVLWPMVNLIIFGTVSHQSTARAD